MKIRKVVMLATLFAVISGGELSAQAKTRMLSKITHVKVTKHRVTGHTTKYAHLKITGLKHHEKASAKANKHGKFVIKVKKNNLKKLNFKIKATKKGYKALTYKYKAVKKATSNKTRDTKQPVKEHATVVNPVESPHKSPASSTAPAKPSTPAKSKAEQIAELRVQLDQAKQNYLKTLFSLKPMIKQNWVIYHQAQDLNSNCDKERTALVNAELARDQANPKDKNYSELNKQVLDAQKKLEKTNSEYQEFLAKHQQQLSDYSKGLATIRNASDQAMTLVFQLADLQPDAPLENGGLDQDFLD